MRKTTALGAAAALTQPAATGEREGAEGEPGQVAAAGEGTRGGPRSLRRGNAGGRGLARGSGAGLGPAGRREPAGGSSAAGRGGGGVGEGNGERRLRAALTGES